MNLIKIKLPIITSSLLIGFINSLVGYHSAWAQDYHPVADITDTASQYVISKIPKEYTIKSLTTAKIDSRIKLKKCLEPLLPFVSGRFKVGRNLTIGVTCQNPQWKYYVPVKTEIMAELVVASRTILKGEYISEDKLSVIRQKINSQQNRYFRETKDIVGKLAKRNIRANRAIMASQLQTNFLVKRKQKVLIVAKNRNLMVKMKGIALENGRSNEIIKVRNIKSNKVIEGLVSAQGVVTVNF